MLRIIECTCIYIGLLQKVITGRTKSTVQVFLWWTVVVCTTRRAALGDRWKFNRDLGHNQKDGTTCLRVNLDQTKKHCVFENGTGKIYLSVVAKLKKERREKESTFHDFSFFLWIVQKFSSSGLIKKKKKNTYDAWKKNGWFSSRESI